LRSAYRRCYQVAGENGLKSIAFPAISAGVYGYPMTKACEIALEEAKAALENYPQLERVVFVPFNEGALQIYQDTFKRIFPS